MTQHKLVSLFTLNRTKLANLRSHLFFILLPVFALAPKQLGVK